MTTWETSKLPADYTKALRQFDAVIVPSEFCHDVFQLELGGTDGTGVPIHIVPYCFDPGFWIQPPHRHRTSSRALRFYVIGAWTERENPLGLLRAYLSAFRRSDRVELGMLMTNADHAAVRSVMARSGLRPEDMPMLVVPESTILTENELVDLHADADCFVTATRCEAFGHGLFDAVSMGNYVIAPNYGGQSEYLDYYPWFSNVPFQMTPCFGIEAASQTVERDGQRMLTHRVMLPAGVDCRQHWADPDLTHIVRAMRWLYEQGGRDVRPRAEVAAARAELEARFGYEVVGQQLATTLMEVLR